MTQQIQIQNQIGPYTYKEYKKLPEDGHRYELHDGYIYMMANPTRKHQDIQDEVLRQFANYLEGKSCKAQTNRDVRLFCEDDESDYVTYVPDIFVLCDQSKDRETYIKGAPDIVIEILSKSTKKMDLGNKKIDYQESGVREYWVIKDIREVHQFVLNSKGAYDEEIYTPFDNNDIKIPVRIWDGRLTVKIGQFVHEMGNENP